MTWWQSLILGLVQGATEFLPVSSSGHLILTGKLLGMEQVPLAFELAVHCATLLAVVIALRKPLFSLLKKPFQKKTALLITATIPTVLIFLLFKSVFTSAFGGQFLIVCFSVTAALILISGAVKVKNPKPLPSFLDAVIIGVAQGIAGFPGISRSGTTVAAATLTGTEKKSAAEFSFLLSLPIIVGSTILEFTGGESIAALAPLPLIVGFVTAFVVGLLSVKLFLKLVSQKSLTPFAVYLTVLVVLLTLDKFLWHIF